MANTIQSLPFAYIVLIFLITSMVIAVAGIRLTRTADDLADATGWGEALFGALLLGGGTSLPGIVTSVSTAYQGFPQLSISNALGGIAAQTAFLSIADITYRRSNLEHAAASFENLMFTTLMITMLIIPVVAMAGPAWQIAHIHPATLVLLGAYGFGLRLISQAKIRPLWRPRYTLETRTDEPDEAARQLNGSALLRLWALFIVLALVVGIAGFVVGQSGIALVHKTGMSETVVGGLFTAISTSLPELVTVLAAVRRGALTLAVGNIIGGNSFDVLFIAFSDVGFLQGSIYHQIAMDQLLLIAACQLMACVLLLGLLKREKSGFGNIGFESFWILVIYLGTFGVLLG